MSGAVAIIPARGGSKRIPRKNIRPFLGRPIIEYPIAAALGSALFDQVIVSTDDEEIAAVARRSGAAVPFLRPRELADDHTGTNAVVRQALQWLAAHGQATELVCCLYATAPFVTAADLAEGRRQLLASGKSFAFSVTRFEFAVQRALRLDPAGAVEALYPEHADTRSQDLEPAWHDAGQFYWGTAAAYLGNVMLYSRAAVGVPIPRHRVQDIDTEEDWRRAELMFEAQRRTERP